MRLPVLLLCVSLAAIAACDDRGVRITTTRSSPDAKGVLKIIDALQCPDTMGSLTRKGSAQADGTVCIYTGPRGAEVTLTLVTLGDTPVEDVLRRFETDLTAVMPRTSDQMTAAADADAARADAEAAKADAEAARADAETARGEEAHISAPGMQIDAQGDRAQVSLPGIHVDADGDKANVRIGGFTIRANDADKANAQVRIHGDLDDGSGKESVSVRANDGAAEVRTRAPGEAVRQTFLLTDNRPSDAGWRLVGYEARGPRGGPIVVATVRAKTQDRHGVFDDAKDLVTLNVGE